MFLVSPGYSVYTALFNMSRTLVRSAGLKLISVLQMKSLRFREFGLMSPRTSSDLPIASLSPRTLFQLKPAVSLLRTVYNFSLIKHLCLGCRRIRNGQARVPVRRHLGEKARERVLMVWAGTKGALVP